MNALTRYLTWLLLLGSLEAAAQTPRPTAAPPPPPPDPVKQAMDLLMPGGKSSTWHLCKPDRSHWDGCDRIVDLLAFDKAKEVILRTPCNADSSLHQEPFKITSGSRGALLSLPDGGIKYRISQPDNCTTGCPGHTPCVRLSKEKNKKADPPVDIYLYHD